MTDKTKGRVKLGMQTDLLSDLMTNHARKIAFIQQNERLEVVEVDVQGGTSNVTADHTYKDIN